MSILYKRINSHITFAYIIYLVKVLNVQKLFYNKEEPLNIEAHFYFIIIFNKNYLANFA